MAPGRKTGGRKPGTPNKVTKEAREVFRALLEKKGPELEQMIDETRATDPGKAADLVLKAAEFCIPKLGRTEIAGDDGGPLTVLVKKYTE